MSGFSWRAAAPSGEVLAGEMRAPSTAAVRSRLRERGLHPVEVRDREESEPGEGSRGGLVTRDLGGLTGAGRELPLRLARELAGLLAAGFSLDQALGMLETVLDGRSDLLSDLRDRVRRGEAFSDALAAHPERFDEFYVNMARAGEEGSVLAEVLDRLATHLEERAEIRRRIATALVYPAVMTVVGGVAVAVLLLLVIPKFAGILEGAGRSLPLSTALVLGASDAASDLWWLWPGLLAGGAAGLYRWRETAEGRMTTDRWILMLPLIGALRRQVLTARFARTMGTLLESGVDFLAAARATEATVTNRALRSLFREAREDVRRGEPMAGAFGRSPLVPDGAVQMIRTGEESGRLDTLLHRVADIYDRKARERTERLVSLLEPGLVLFFGVVVGFVAYAMLAAILSINEVPL